MKRKHTPTPWNCSLGPNDCAIFQDVYGHDAVERGETIATVYAHNRRPEGDVIAYDYATRDANAILMVTAVNNHHDLLIHALTNASLSSEEMLNSCSKDTLVSLLCGIRNQAKNFVANVQGCSPEEISYAAEQQHLEEKAEMRARYGVPASDRGRK